MAGISLVLLLIVPGVQHFVQGQQVSPKLDPATDSRWSKDYPHDQQPTVSKYYTFDHPYPAVQDTGDFDKDYVKDENSDGGKWAAQMTYDVLRSKIRKKEAILTEYKNEVKHEEEEVEAVKAEEQKAEEAKKAAEQAVEDAKKAAGAAAKAVDELEGVDAGAGGTTGGAVGEAVERVDKAVKNLEECKARLEAAKAKLQGEISDEEKTKEQRELAEQKRKAELDRMAAGSAEADTAVKSQEEVLAELDAKIKDQRAIYNKARLAYSSEYENIEATKETLKKAEDKLRALRRKSVDPDGGVYYKEKSGASRVAAPAVLLITAFATALSHLG